jgi:hypothetical protein
MAPYSPENPLNEQRDQWPALIGDVCIRGGVFALAGVFDRAIGAVHRFAKGGPKMNFG